MSKHTPGPWVISSESLKLDGTPDIGITAPGRWINLAGVYKTTGSKVRDAEANARLIAAAPDLLAACIEVKQYLDGMGLDWLGKGADPLEAAIAKATGQTP